MSSDFEAVVLSAGDLLTIVRVLGIVQGLVGAIILYLLLRYRRFFTE